MKKFLVLLLVPVIHFTTPELSKSKSQPEAVKKATQLVESATKLTYNSSQLFTEENKFVVKFTNDSEYVLVYFNYTKEADDENYIFNQVTGSQTNLTAIWKANFSDTNLEKFFDQQNKVVYYLTENEDYWRISKRSLQ